MTTEARPPQPDRLVHWTVADIDAAILVVRGRRDACGGRGDTFRAAEHQRWLDRLLDARPYHVASEETEGHACRG